MKKTITITISRQFGSNGREIGRKLAEYLDIGYYNKEIMEKIAKDMGVSSDFFNEDNQNEDGLYSISNRKLRSFGSIAELSVNSQVFERATDLICGIAQRESSVIVGRCADYILKDIKNCTSVYLYADREFRKNRVKEIYGSNAEIMDKEEKNRADYYNYYTGNRWGDINNYYFAINTSKVSFEEAADLIYRFAKDKQKNLKDR